MHEAEANRTPAVDMPVKRITLLVGRRFATMSGVLNHLDRIVPLTLAAEVELERSSPGADDADTGA